MRFLRRAPVDRREEAEKEIEKNLSPSWKREALAGFRQWLDALPDEEPPAEDAPEGSEAGMIQLADALSALGRETKALARSSEQSRRRLEGFLEDVRSEPPAVDACAELAALEARLRSQVLEQGRKERDEVLLALGDAYESLMAARERLSADDAPPAPAPGGFFRRRAHPPARPAPGAALSIPIRKLRDILSRHRVEEVARVGEAFDAACMRAGALSDEGLVPPGHVSAIVRQGYKIQGNLLQTAEVAVEREKGA